MGINFMSSNFIIENDKVFRRQNSKKGKYLGQIQNDLKNGPFILHEKIKTHLRTALSGHGSELNSLLWDIYGGEPDRELIKKLKNS